MTHKFLLHFAELQIGCSIKYKNTLFGNCFLKCNKVKRMLMSFNWFSEYTLQFRKTPNTVSMIYHERGSAQTVVNVVFCINTFTTSPQLRTWNFRHFFAVLFIYADCFNKLLIVFNLGRRWLSLSPLLVNCTFFSKNPDLSMEEEATSLF